MRKAILITLPYLLIAGIFPARHTRNLSNITADTIPAYAQKLIKCYPDLIEGFSGNYLIFKDHSKLLWDDGIKNKPFQALLDKPDLKDMFSQHYETGSLKTPPAKNFDPGRIRTEPFFTKVYGRTEA